jgi:hypothetical protein
VLVVIAAGLVALPAILWATTSASSFSGQVLTPPAGCVYCSSDPNHTASLPVGKNVDLHWSDQTGGFVSFAVAQPGSDGYAMAGCLWHNASSGSCSFMAIDGNYSFSASNPPGFSEGSQLVDYSGSYPTSIL